MAYHSDLDTPLNVGEQPNHLLEAEPLETTLMKVRHSRLVGADRARSHVLIIFSNQGENLPTQLLF
jgi:hypothetical protein